MESFHGEYMTLECSNHELAEKIGKTIACVLSPKNCRNPLVIVGRDDGLSSENIYDSICRGICSAGIVAEKLGVSCPSAVSYLARSHNANAGIMITSMPDGKYCGIRFYSENGYKIGYETGEEIKKFISKSPEELEKRLRPNKGGVIICENSVSEYMDFIKQSIDIDLSGIKIALKCSNNTVRDCASEVLHKLGAEVTIISKNDILSSDNNFDCGFIIENDGESCIAVDEKSNVIDNDILISVFAEFYKKNNLLKKNSFVVVREISYGFMKFAEENNIKVITAGLSENSIITRMTENNYNVGADNNGRFIFLDEMHTSDGLFTAIKLLYIMNTKKSKLSSLTNMKHYSQVAVNVEIPVRFREIWKNDCVITENIAHYIHLLGNRGKIFIQENYVYPAINIIAEGMDYVDINDAVQNIAQKIKERIIRKESES